MPIKSITHKVTVASSANNVFSEARKAELVMRRVSNLSNTNMDAEAKVLFKKLLGQLKVSIATIESELDSL